MQAPNFPRTKSHVHFSLLTWYQSICSGATLLYEYFITLRFYVEELLAPHPTPKLEDNPLSDVRNC